MFTALLLITLGITIRQADRWWHSPRRGRHTLKTLRDVMALQRQRVNDATPVLLLIGHWVEIAGWCLFAAHHGVWAWVLTAVVSAVKMRHLQEVSHFAVHGVLTRNPRLSAFLAEAAVHLPLGFVPVPVRRQRHVREHHPNATVSGVDPNLADLHQAGLHPGVATRHFVRAVVFPLTPHGIVDTVQGIYANIFTSQARWGRFVALAAAPTIATWAWGWHVALFVFVIPRLLFYPQLAWMSLLVEHRWFDAEPIAGPPAVVEAARCLRMYPNLPALALLARGTWLPYGDLYHYAHSAHPSVRWNFLPALEHAIGFPHYSPDALLLGDNAVLRRHRKALAADTVADAPQTVALLTR
ncbi:fatty acid desaturase [Streptomyces sp. NPDC058195]|uniref:fatty acid desaturase n=1 Tax=Streptomyces sp. NPDC058195 TaxID=3346375 RepID=UPI0036EFF1F2